MLCVVTAQCHVEASSWVEIAGAGCQPGYVKLNGSPILDMSQCSFARRYRGTQIHLIDPFACTKIEYRRFDTWLSTDEAERLRDYLDQLDDFSVIVGSMLDEATRNLAPAHNALLRVGVDLRDLEWKGSFVFVTQKSTNKTVLVKTLNLTLSGQNPPRVSVMITGMRHKVPIPLPLRKCYLATPG